MCLSDVRNLTKLVDLLLLIAYVILLVLIQFQYLQQEQILALQERRVIQWSCDTGKFSQGRTLLLIDNLKLSNGKKIQQQEPHMIIQADTSTKGRK